MSGTTVPTVLHVGLENINQGGNVRQLRLGIDIACRTPHQASLADETGRFIWSGRRFRTSIEELEALWASLPGDAEITVVIEPTRNAWVPIASWFRRKGATVVMVPSEQSADLRDYYSKHTKSDRIDSKLLARLPLLHPEGLRPLEHLGPAEPLRRATRLRSSLVKRRTEIVHRIDALLEILGPHWYSAFDGKIDQLTPLRFLAAWYADPYLCRRLGKARNARFMHRHSHGRWNTAHASAVIAAAKETLELWGDELDFGELADDLAMEAELALTITTQIHELEQRIDVMRRALDPTDILRSVPGVGSINAAQILARLADPSRFRSLAGVRSYSGLVPSLNSSGRNGAHGGPTKSGDALLREALFNSADVARKIDPTLAQRYHRLMTEAGKHHNSAVCSIAPALLTRIVACWRSGGHYVIRDVDGTAITPEEGRRIVAERYTVRPELRALRRTTKPTEWTSRRSKESLGAPSTGSSTLEIRERMHSSA
jgi:transposase